MRKAKIMLLTIAVIGLISGAMAFNARSRINHIVYCCTTAMFVCDEDPYIGLTTVQPADLPEPVFMAFCTTVLDAPCLFNIPIYTIDNNQ